MSEEPSKSGPGGASNFAQRLLTAAVLIPILVVSMFVDPTSWSILGASAIAVFFATDEFVRMAIGVDSRDRALGLRAALGVAGAGVVIGNSVAPKLMGETASVMSVMAPLMFAAAMLVAVAVLARKQHLPEAGRHLSYALAGLVYVPMLGCVWPLLKQDFGAEWLFMALALAFLSDTFAYFGGRAFGKHKLYEAVSPKKTVEGAIGGLVGGVAAMIGMGHFWLTPQIPISHAIALGLLGSALGQIGDLVESMIKRTFKIKDSGNILPGHGGMLDRVDGLLFVAPLVYYYAKLFL